MRARRYGFEPSRSDAEHGHDRAGGEQRATGRAGHGEHPDEHQDECDRRPEVGFGEQQHAEDPDQEADRPRELLERLGRAAAGQEPGRPHGERELGELGRLEDDRSEGDPAARAVHGRSEDEDGDAQDEAHEDEHRRQLLQRAEADSREDEEEQQPDGGVDPLPFQVRVRIAVRDRGGRRRRAVDHDQPERDERQRDEDEDLDVEVRALHESDSTSRRKASPRSSKLRNWS